jgi:hypothetical protein
MRMGILWYIIDENHNPVAVDVWGYEEWLRRDGDDVKRVAFTDVNGVTVSTVFLALDHNFFDDGPPILFETMVFDHPFTGENAEAFDGMRRYRTWDEAERGHSEVVALVRRSFLRIVGE